jgi:eukaryotic-like serine/threonine-protein kinase
MLTGTQPYQGEQAVQIAYQHANENIPAPSSVNGSVPELLDEIVLWTTARNPAHRPASAEALYPVIQRARADLSRGLTTSLQQIDKTARIDFDQEFVAPAGATEVISLETLERGEFESEFGTKLAKANSRSKFWLTAFTLLAIFGGAGSGWWFSSGPGGLAVIPDLTGRTLEAAIEALSPLEIVIEQAEENSATVQLGNVSRTDPPAGSRVFKGSNLTIYLSLGPKQLSVPNAIGLSSQEARTLLTDSGFTPGSIRNFFSAEPTGQVFGLSAEVGAILNQGSVLDILVSVGPLPEVTGLSIEEARVLLDGLDLKIEESEVFSNEVPQGSVVGLILDKTPLPEGGQVTIEISKGPEIVIMPNVVGETIAAAKTLLENLGLRVVIDTNQLTSNFGIAKVRSQNPASGTEARVGDSVTIVSR